MTPGLTVIVVGERPDSLKYVQKKEDLASALGLRSRKIALPKDATAAELRKVIGACNTDDDCDGVLLQLPLPAHLSARAALLAVDPAKDVDGFHPVNVGRLASWRETTLAPCTPRGVVQMLHHAGVRLAGAHVAVVGESNVVGQPLALMLLAEQATVTVVHKHTPNPAALCREADVVVSAAGVARLVTKEWIKPGATVVDVGINFAPDPNRGGAVRVRAVTSSLRPVRGLSTSSPRRRRDPSTERRRVRNRPTTAPARARAVLASSVRRNLQKRARSTLRTKKFGYRPQVRMCGDVHENVWETAGVVSPVPGGVGPMTVAMLMRNTVDAALLRLKWLDLAPSKLVSPEDDVLVSTGEEVAPPRRDVVSSSRAGVSDGDLASPDDMVAPEEIAPPRRLRDCAGAQQNLWFLEEHEGQSTLDCLRRSFGDLPESKLLEMLTHALRRRNLPPRTTRPLTECPRRRRGVSPRPGTSMSSPRRVAATRNIHVVAAACRRDPERPRRRRGVNRAPSPRNTRMTVSRRGTGACAGTCCLDGKGGDGTYAARRSGETKTVSADFCGVGLRASSYRRTLAAPPSAACSQVRRRAGRRCARARENRGRDRGGRRPPPQGTVCRGVKFASSSAPVPLVHTTAPLFVRRPVHSIPTCT